jgi:hypothetical protein
MHPETLFFDWYEATLDGRATSDKGYLSTNAAADVIGTLCEALDVSMLATLKGMHGYDHCARLGTSEDGERVCDVLSYADPAKAHQVHVVSSGVSASRVSNALRLHWPQHKVSRVDVSFDMLLDRGYDQVKAHALWIARDLGIKVAPCIEDSLDADAGRSQYIGSPRSIRQVIAYEKGKQLRTQGVDGVDPNWLRVELTTRPQSKHKARYATLSPADIGAESPVFASLCAAFGPRAGTRQPYSVGHTNGTIESIACMVKQYGRAIRELIGNHCGGDAHRFGVILASVASTGGGSAELTALLTGSH